MGDDAAGDLDRPGPRYLADDFDIKPKHLQVSFIKESLDKEESSFGVNRRRSESLVEIPESGIVFLLGKNGSGKTRFITGLTAFANSGTEEFPSVSLICEIPNFESQLQFYDEMENLRQEKWFTDLCEDGYSNPDEKKPLYQRQYCSLGFFTAVFDSFLACQIPSVPFPLHGLGKSELLRSFGADDVELEQWQKRTDLFDMQNTDYHPGMGDAQDAFPASFVFGEHFLDFIIASLSMSYFHLEGWNFRGPEQYESGKEWWSDPAKRNTVFLALKEMASSATHIRVQSKYDRKEFELLVRKPDSGPICDLLNERIGPDRNDPWSHLNTIHGFADSYPFDLLQEVDLFGEIYIRSIPIPFADTFRTGKYTRDSWNLMEVAIFDSDGKREESVLELERKIFSRFCNEKSMSATDKDEESSNSRGDRYTFTMYGYDKIDSFLKGVSKAISICEIGIEELRAVIPKGGSFVPQLEFRDSEAKEWLPLAKSSQGQFDVMQLFLELYLLDIHTASLRVIVADEFDKHLHPKAATKVLEVVQRYSTLNRIVSIFSTHSISQYLSPSIRSQPRIFFDRSAEGNIQLTEWSSAEPYVVAEILGTTEMDAYLLKRLYVMVEGDHDVAIFKDLFKSDAEILEDIHIFSSAGTLGFAGTWETLRLLYAPVLIVYDKKSDVLESSWNQIQKAAADPKNKLHLWYDFGLQKIWDERNKRKRTNSAIAGDTELNSLLYLLRNILDVGNSGSDPRRNSQRIFLHGVAYPDIVDALPIKYFTSSYKSWEEAREINNTRPTSFKEKIKINTVTVKNALANIEIHSDPELLKLKEKVQKILNR